MAPPVAYGLQYPHLSCSYHHVVVLWKTLPDHHIFQRSGYHSLNGTSSSSCVFHGCHHVKPLTGQVPTFSRLQQRHQNNSYLSNRNTVLSDLRNHASLGSYYYNTTAGLSPNTVYGMFFCIGNISRTFCSECVDSVMSYQGKTCDSDHDSSFIFSSQDCMVWYTDAPFFALVLDAPASYSYPPNSSLDTPHFFNRTFPEKLDKLILRASSSLSSPIPYFVENQENVTQLEGSYHLKAMVQCSPDLVPHNCTVCLRLAVQNFFKCCNQPPWGRISLPKCVIRYNISALQPSLGNTKGKEGYGRTLFAIMTALVLALMG